MDIGPRPPGSDGERAASRLVSKELGSLGLEVQEESFKTPVSSAWSSALVRAMAPLGLVLFPLSPALSFLLVSLGFFFYLLEEHGRSPFLHLQPHRRSANVVARVEPVRKAERRLVIMAHLDSPRSAFYYHPRLTRFFRLLLLSDFLGQVLAFMLAVVLFGGHLLHMDKGKLLYLWKLSLIPVVPLFLAFASTLHKALFGKATPGGNDNASGVAVALQLASLYSKRRPLQTELWFAFTGASDAGGEGLKFLLKKHKKELRKAYFIVLDQVGRGFPLCYRREGRLIPFRADRNLFNLARHISRTYVHYTAGAKANSLYNGEGYQLLSRGRKALTVSTRANGGNPRYWRWKKDDYYNVDPRSLRLSTDFVQTLVDHLDRHGTDVK
jgi:hypothetical protein